MKKITLLIVLILSTFSITFSQNVGIGTNTPSQSAQLEVSSNNKGFLPPRVSLVGTNAQSPITNPSEGLLVYNISNNGSAPYEVSPGYYYWNGLKWIRVTTVGNAFGDMQYWDGEKWIIIPIGNEKEKLTVCDGKPKWGNCIDTLALKPQANPDEVYFTSYSPTTNTKGISQLTIAGWTASGTQYAWRTLLKFDLSSIPSNAVIHSAKLSLYSTPTPGQGNGIDAQYGTNNMAFIQRAVGNWNASTVNWNTQPASTTTNQVTIPQSVSSFEDNINLDVTDLIKDIQQNTNYGFLIKLQNEVPYNTRQYASSFNTEPTKHPKLIVTYTKP